MDINLTLLGQMITFMLFVWFTMKFVWPPISKAIEDRQKQISDGLAKAQAGQEEWAIMQKKSEALLAEGKDKAAQYITDAKARGDKLIDQAKDQAKHEANKILDQAKAEIDRQYKKAQAELNKEAVNLAVGMTEKLIGKIDPNQRQSLLDDWVAEG